ncbi:MAG: bifunctional phosphoribosylaminoimidazolecarboxamide formyltransferase/IMP cyclohydrolase [Actinobacteria bacterium]|nr:bifunctional phosphoribosylaminoimidazolecarboxamide formyltransferase/IMP cyclohydrolase [Actinomycetota bacterium]
MRIRTALISVSDKRGLIELAKALSSLEVKIISTGGTLEALTRANLRAHSVSEMTGFPEILGGRVKTLHPLIHAGILFDRDNQDHVNQMAEMGISGIDMVVVNLYPFAEVITRPDISRSEAIENIDIGGPTMIRAAAKNQSGVLVVVDPDDYPEIIAELKKKDGHISLQTRQRFAAKVFKHTADYDATIASYFDQERQLFPGNLTLNYRKVINLRYGENPIQPAALYAQLGTSGGFFKNFKQLSGKELSYNNVLDIHSAWRAVSDLRSPACVIVKHNNPCGAAIGSDEMEVFLKSLGCDPLSAFGGIVAVRKRIDAKLATEITRTFFEAVIASEIDNDALDILRTREKLIVASISSEMQSDAEYRFVDGALLLQAADIGTVSREELEFVTDLKPTEGQIDELLFAMAVCKHVKSNAIVISSNFATVGIGAGQMSRVDSVKIAIMKAGERSKGSVLASDAFFPFRDSIDEAAKTGTASIIQPGGSNRDAEVIEAANQLGVSMVFTGRRHFRH